VLARCDALDGAVDGIVADSRACQAAFQIDRDVPTCTGARDGSCLSAEQKAVVGSIFRGPVAADGRPVYASFPYDAGHGTAGVAFWEFNAAQNLDPGALAFVMGTPPERREGFAAPAYARSVGIDELVRRIGATDAPYTESGLSFMTPPRPDQLHRVQSRGAKVLVYHGLSDAIFSSNDTLAWLAALRATHGSATSSFVRYFPVPGMGHCSGGPATEQVDWLTPLVAWVEQGRAPERIEAAARGAGNAGGANADLPPAWSPTRTRPLCPAPLVARYNGSGDIERAASFECRP
jgi:Tannase and feruloyl esterase